MAGEVRIAPREATLVMSKRMPVRISEIGAAVGASFGEAYAHIAVHEVPEAGPPFIIYHGMPHGDDPFDIEICAPISRALDPHEGWRLTELPAGQFATLVHVGPYDTIGLAYDALGRWLDAHGFVMAGPPREVYLSPPDTAPAETRTIIEYPVSEVRSAVTAG